MPLSALIALFAASPGHASPRDGGVEAARAVFEPLTQAYHQGTVARPAAPPPPNSGSEYLDVYQSGDLLIVHDDDGEWLIEATDHILSNDLNWILDSVSGAFYEHCGDDYQYLDLLLVNDLGFFGAFYAPMANDVRGIGADDPRWGEVYDTTNTQMEGFIFMNAAQLWAENPEAGRFVFGQEFMHRWGAFVTVDHEELEPDALLGRDLAHWSYWFSTTNSPMEGNTWVDNGDGTWTIDYAATSTYSDLDLYLMGLVGPEDVPEQTVLLVSDEEQARVERERASAPEALVESLYGAGSPVTVTATPVHFGLDAIIAAEGEREPTVADSPKAFRMATIVLVLSHDKIDDDALAMLDGVRTRFESDWEADVRGLADLDTSLGKCDAPVWGAPEDTGVADTGADDTDPADTDTAKGETGCGCASSPGTPAVGLLLAALALSRRRA